MVLLHEEATGHPALRPTLQLGWTRTNLLLPQPKQSSWWRTRSSATQLAEHVLEDAAVAAGACHSFGVSILTRAANVFPSAVTSSVFFLLERREVERLLARQPERLRGLALGNWSRRNAHSEVRAVDALVQTRR